MSSQRTSRTLQALQNEVVFNAGNRTDLTSQAVTAINLAVEELQRRHSWKCLRTTQEVPLAIGDTYVDVDIYDIQEIRVRVTTTQVYPLTVVDKKKFLEVYPTLDGVAQNWPWICYMDQALGRLFFGPKPSSTYTLIITGVSLPEEMVDPTDTVPIRADLAIICWASAYLLNKIGMQDLAVQWTNQFENALATAIIDDNRIVGMEHQRELFRAEERYVGGTPWLDPFVRGT